MCSEIGHTRQNCPRYATRNNRYIAAAVGDDANPEVRQLAERFSSNNLFHKTVLRVIISKPQQGTKVDTISWNRKNCSTIMLFCQIQMRFYQCWLGVTF
nr:uncharacterized protein LOC118683628 isoform X2 [Bactrocera oleae]